jgi:hypothetical protein
MRRGADLAFSDAQVKFNGDYKNSAKISYKIINQGAENITSSFKVKLYLSNDNKLDAADSILFQKEYSALSCTDTISENFDCKLPYSPITKTYYIFISCDAENQQMEISKINNVATLSTTIIGKPNVDILFPYPNTLWTYRQVAVYVAYDTTQQIDTSAIILKVNNINVTSKILKWTYKIIYYPSEPYSDSINYVSIFLKNKFGYDSTFSWKFNILIPNSVAEVGTIGDYKLNQNYPNPFNPSTMISYKLPTNNYVTLKIYDITGRNVVTLVSEIQSAGSYNISWNPRSLPSGIYYYRLQAGSFTQMKKLVLLK